MEKKDYSSQQEVLASFFSKVIARDGWWFRLPKWNPNAKQTAEVQQDIIMPHFGRLFGLTEEASAHVLAEIGLMNHQKNGAITYNASGWETFAGRFILDDVVEAKSVKFSGKAYYYVWIGTVDSRYKSATAIWDNYKKNERAMSCPVGMSDRSTTKFIAEELREILVQSKFFHTIGQVSYYGNTGGLFSKTKLRITASEITEAERIKESQNEEADTAEIRSPLANTLTSALEVITPEFSSTVIDQIQFPLLHKWKINVDDEQVVETLLSELVRYKRTFNNQTDTVQGVKMPKDSLVVKHEFDNPAKHRLYLPVPSGFSQHTADSLAKNTITSLDWAVRNASTSIKGDAGKLMIEALQKNMADEFENIAEMSEYISEMTNVMAPEFCAAMYEDAEIGRKSQKKLNQYLTYHFGKRVTAHEYEVQAVLSD